MLSLHLHPKPTKVKVLRNTYKCYGNTSTGPSKSGHTIQYIWPAFEGSVEVLRNTWQVLPYITGGLIKIEPCG